MSRRSDHRFDHTMGEAHEIFSRLLGKESDPYYQRVLALTIDGVTIAQTRADQRKPGSNFYGQGFFEALAVARVFVGLNLDYEVADIQRSDKPDVRVGFCDGSAIYVEHTSVVEHDGMTFGRYLDDVNAELRDLIDGDERARTIVEAGYAEIKLTDPGFKSRPPVSALAKDVLSLLPTLSCKMTLVRPRAALYPVLGAFQPLIFYRPGSVANYTICSEGATWVDPTPEWVGRRLVAALEAKIRKAAEYPADARPLWLLITLDAESLFPPFVSDLVIPALKGRPIAPFDRVIVWSSGCQPFVFN